MEKKELKKKEKEKNGVGSERKKRTRMSKITHRDIIQMKPQEERRMTRRRRLM
jgi:hypothetical protein